MACYRVNVTLQMVLLRSCTVDGQWFAEMQLDFDKARQKILSHCHVLLHKSHGLAWDRTQASALRGRRPADWSTTKHAAVSLVVTRQLILFMWLCFLRDTSTNGCLWYLHLGKGKVCPRTDHEDPEGEYRYRSTLSITSAWDAVG
jgi:hypothetical protein